MFKVTGNIYNKVFVLFSFIWDKISFDTHNIILVNRSWFFALSFDSKYRTIII